MKELSRRTFVAGAVPATAAAVATTASDSNYVDPSLIDAAAVRKSLPRLFSGDWSEIIGELLQNSQRAGSKNVHITDDVHGNVVGRYCMTWQDDGCGLDGSDESFRALLAIGVSGWSEEVIANQAPLGLGLHALLAMESTHSVSLASGGRAITIDRDRWWNDPAYYNNWPKLITSAPNNAGLRITAVYTRQTAAYVKSTYDLLRRACQGYGDMLKVHFAGEELPMHDMLHNPPVPDHLVDTDTADKWTKLTYEGQCVWLPPVTGVRVGNTCVINWYGQICRVAIGNGTVQRYYDEPFSAGHEYPLATLVVRDSAVLTMQSPSRRGVVDDNKWRAFITWLTAQYRTRVARAKKRPTVALLRTVLTTWPELRRDAAWAVACHDTTRCGKHRVDMANPTVYSLGEWQQQLAFISDHTCTITVADEDTDEDSQICADVALRDSDFDDDTGRSETLFLEDADLLTIHGRKPARSLFPLESMPAAWHAPVWTATVRFSAPHPELTAAYATQLYRPDAVPSLRFFTHAELVWTNGAQTVRSELPPCTTYIDQTDSTDCSNASAFIVCGPDGLEQSELRDALMFLWRHNDEDCEMSYDEQQALFARSVDELLHAMSGDESPAVHRDATVVELNRALALSETDTLRVIQDTYKRHVETYVITDAEGNTREVRLIG